MVKDSPASAGDTRDTGLIPGSGRSPGEENDNLIHSHPDKSMDRGSWQVPAFRVTKSQKRLSIQARAVV